MLIIEKIIFIILERNTNLNNQSVRSKHIDFVILDIISIIVCMVSAYALYIIFYLGEKNDVYMTFFMKIGMGVIALYLIIMLFQPIHSKILKRNKVDELKRVIVLNIEILGLLLLSLFIVKQTDNYSRATIMLFFVFDIILMYILRVIWKKVIRTRFKEGKQVSHVIVATYRRSIRDYLDELKKNNNGYYDFIGILLLNDEHHPDNTPITSVDGVPVIEGDLLDFMKDNEVNEVFLLAKHGESARLSKQFLNMGITTHISLNLEMSASLDNVSLENTGKYTTITTRIDNGSTGELIVKRIFDIFVSIIGLIFTGILYLIFAPIIKKQSPGPAFFGQERVGKNGRIFKMYKFRSMYMDAEERKKELMAHNEMSGLMFKMEDDPRIMPIGKFIRKTSIDEFPQFWNILKGDMSLVGTRPPTLDEFKQYDPHHLSRLAMKPGLTGMWQCSGRSDITDFEEVVKLDNDYIRNFSILLDFKIILKTFVAVFDMKGSK